MARQVANANLKKKYLVYLCDDQQEMIDRFLRNQKGNFEIRSFTRINELKDAAVARRPDVVLIDLFWAVNNGDEDARRSADEKLRKFQDQLPSLRDAIYRAYAPNGIAGLKLFRDQQSLRDIPIMIYSRTGQLLLSAEDLQEVIKASAEWLPKNQKNVTPDIECLWIEKHIESQKIPWYKKPPHDFRWQVMIALVSTIVGVILGRLF